MEDLMLRAYKASRFMEPIALRDYYVKVITYQQIFFRQVTFYEVIPPFQVIDTGAIAAGAQAPKANVTNLEMWANEFGQWRWFPLDDMQTQLFCPSGVAKWQLKNLQVGITKAIIYQDPELLSTEFCSWEDQWPAVINLNFTGYALPASRIIAFGYRFHTQEVDQIILNDLKAGRRPVTPVQCAGFAGSSK